MSDIAIKVENLGKSYRLGTLSTKTLRDDVLRWMLPSRFPQKEDSIVWALSEMNFEIKRGDAVGIVGKNGAGKSTLLKLLSRTTAPTTGSIKINGKISSLLEVGTGFHPELTGRENVFLNGAIMGMSKSDIKLRFDEIVEFSGVGKYIDTPVKRYSSGMYVRLAFAVAAHLETEIMIIDEVLAVGDVDFQKKCIGKMKDVSKNQGRTVLFVSHNMATVKALCNHGLFLEKGMLRLSGTVTEITDAYTTANKGLLQTTELAERTDRTGNGTVKVIGFWVEDHAGKSIDTILTGEDVVFCFNLACGPERAKNIDFGFSFYDGDEGSLAVIYSSYQSTFFDSEPNSVITVKCGISKFAFTMGSYKIGTRVVVNNEESDWLQAGAGFIRVENGDFFGTGNSGFSQPFMVNVLGKWEKTDLKSF
jgi:lipopolysaccharide transport system ATP-binding protein